MADLRKALLDGKLISASSKLMNPLRDIDKCNDAGYAAISGNNGGAGDRELRKCGVSGRV